MGTSLTLITLFLAFSTTLCSPQPICNHHLADGPNPLPSHCARIIAHIPSVADDRIPFPALLLSSSVPFFTDVTFRHESCIVVLRVFSINPYSDDPRSNAILLHESSLFRSWRALRRTAEEVQEQCVKRDLWGYAGGDFPTISRGRLYVSIHAYREAARDFANENIGRNRRLIEKGLEYLRSGQGRNQMADTDIAELWASNPFGSAIYDI